jgi:hypothetical protein
VTSTLFKTAFAALLVCSLAARVEAADGILLVTEITSDSGPRSTHVEIEATRMRAEIAGAAGASQVVIFDGTKQVMSILNPDKKTYTEMTKADVDALGSQMQGAMAQMQAQMANLPPAQRAQMEAMMRGRGMGAAAVKTTYRRAGSDTVGRWACDKYEGYQGTEKVSDICTVAPSALGFSTADFAITEQMAAFFSKMMPQGANQIATIGRLEDQGFSGFPVRSIVTVAGHQVTSEVKEAKRQAFPDSQFTVPAGFQKQPLMGGMGRGR